MDRNLLVMCVEEQIENGQKQIIIDKQVSHKTWEQISYLLTMNGYYRQHGTDVYNLVVLK